jgi:hypothetical protein
LALVELLGSRLTHQNRGLAHVAAVSGGALQETHGAAQRQRRESPAGEAPARRQQRRRIARRRHWERSNLIGQHWCCLFYPIDRGAENFCLDARDFAFTSSFLLIFCGRNFSCAVYSLLQCDLALADLPRKVLCAPRNISNYIYASANLNSIY